MAMAQLLLQFIKAERTGDWLTFFSTLTARISVVSHTSVRKVTYWDFLPNLAKRGMHSLAHELGLELCNALLGFHVLTWCYSSSTHSGFGKKRGLNVLHGSRAHEWNSWENNPNSATSLQKHVKLSYVQSTQNRTKG